MTSIVEKSFPRGARRRPLLGLGAGLLLAGVFLWAPAARAAGPRNLVNRLYLPSTGEHFYTQSPWESASLGASGWTLEAAPAYTLEADPAPGLVPFYRCQLPWAMHFSTTSPACEGAGYIDDVLGYLAPAPMVGPSDPTEIAVPLYRLSAWNGDHLYTVSLPERNFARDVAGYADEGIAGYVWTGAGQAASPPPPPPPVCGDGLCDAAAGEDVAGCPADCGGIGTLTQPLDGSPTATSITGQIVCEVPEGQVTAVVPAVAVAVQLTINGRAVPPFSAGNFGNFAVPFDTFPGDVVTVQLTYGGTIVDPVSMVSSDVAVVDDLGGWRGDGRELAPSTYTLTSPGPNGKLGLGSVRFTSVDCELWAYASEVARA